LDHWRRAVDAQGQPTLHIRKEVDAAIDDEIVLATVLVRWFDRANDCPYDEKVGYQR
jgi:hypothetical protein